MRWLLVVSMLVWQPAWGWFLDGETLYEICSSAEPVNAAGCEAYIIGAFDSEATRGEDVCRPEGLRASQIVDVVIAYLERHPEQHARPAASLVRYALVTAFPCP